MAMIKKYNVTIIGGGNIGSSIAAYLSENGYFVTILSSKPDSFGKSIELIDNVTGKSFIADIAGVTDNLKDAVADAELIYVTYPSFMIQELFSELSKLLNKPVLIGVLPGTGGVEFYGKELVKSGHFLFGFDRVPCIARIKEYGKSVLASKKKSVRCAALQSQITAEICKINSDLLCLECIPLRKYLTVTFTPSNSILHTSRTYTLFQNYQEGTVYERNFLYYNEWDDAASSVLLAMDEELQQICAFFDEIDLSEMIFSRDHYGVYSVKELTQKLRSIESLKNIPSPMKKVSTGYIPDFQSRYFIEDIPYGLCVLKAFGLIAGIETPVMDKVLIWHQKMLNKEYFKKDGSLGSNSAETAIPQNFGIKTKKEVYKYYMEM